MRNKLLLTKFSFLTQSTYRRLFFKNQNIKLSTTKFERNLASGWLLIVSTINETLYLANHDECCLNFIRGKFYRYVRLNCLLMKFSICSILSITLCKFWITLHHINLSFLHVGRFNYKLDHAL